MRKSNWISTPKTDLMKTKPHDIYRTLFLTEDGYLHRIDGPAVCTTAGYEAWYYKGEQIFVQNQKEFERWLKLRAFL